MTRSAVVERSQDLAPEMMRPAGATTDHEEDEIAAAMAAGFSATLISDVREVRKLMCALQSRFATKDAVEMVARDWRLVASCLDRALFCLYCVVVAVSLAVYFPRSEA